MEGKKILVVDDEFTIRYLVEHQLKRHGFETILAKDGTSALQAAKTYKPDLVVLDIMMPGMDGFAVCKRIKDDPQLADIPVIFLTALANNKDKLRAFEMGGDDYLTKPFQGEEFLAHITAVLRRTDQSSNIIDQSGTKQKGRITALYSPKGGVGTTTLAIQISEALVLRDSQKVILIDLALPLGGLATLLNLYSTRHIIGLLNASPEDLSLDAILRFTQRHRVNLLAIPAPGYFVESPQAPNPERLISILDLLVADGQHVVLDLGSAMSPLTLAAMKKAEKSLILTSGQPLANRHMDTLLTSARQIGLDPNRLMPIINELYGPVDDFKLSRVPVARIPQTDERARTRLWLQDEDLRELVSVVLA